MTQKRPVNLALTKFHYPPMAIVSITHRITGVLLFLFLPFVLYMLHQSLHSADTFLALQQLLTHNWVKFLVWVLLSATSFHWLAGIRHLCMDLGWWESLPAARFTAFSVWFFQIILMILGGVWLWV